MDAMYLAGVILKPGWSICSAGGGSLYIHKYEGPAP